MKILETIFFTLMIAIPTFFILLAIANITKVKMNKKFRKTIIKMIFISLLVNGIIWGALKMTNDKELSSHNDSQKYDTKYEDEDDKENEDDDKGSGDLNGEPHQNEPNSKPSEPNNQTTTVTKPNNTTNPPTGSTEPPTTSNVVTNGVTTKGFAIETKDGITYVDGYLIVNKTYPLPTNYRPTNPHNSSTADNCPDCLNEDAYTAYTRMKTDASANGLGLWIASGFRSYTYQSALYGGYVNRNGKAAADTYSARPGHSEHQSGFAFDLNTVTESFANTKEGIWVNQNCYKYGFIIRYPKGKDNETGYIYEPWHLRYVGVDLATKLYNGGDWITMESYFGITSQYQS